MGHCAEFGCSIGGGCSHPMEVRDSGSCGCTSCGVVCQGRFQGCPTVWSRGRTELPTATDRDVDFIALPYVGLDSPSVNPEASEAGVPAAEPPGQVAADLDAPVPLEVALALQQTVNQELLEAIRRLEATVAELTATPPLALEPATPPPAPAAAPKERRGRSVDVLQWVEGGVPSSHPAGMTATVAEERTHPSAPSLRRPPRRRLHRR